MNNDEIQMTDQIWELSRGQAQEVLNVFLAAQRESFPSLVIGTVSLDYSPESVAAAAHHIASEIMAGQLDVEQQNIWFARLGYYMGEAVCKAMPGLSWGLGDPEYAFANHPVIIGFSDGDEAPTITMCRNFIRSVAEGRSPPQRIDNGVATLFNKTVA
jgi:hypothetical protein